jgi:hypothetical protein
MSEVTSPAEPGFGSSPAETMGDTEPVGRLTVRVMSLLRTVCSPVGKPGSPESLARGVVDLR